MPRFFIVATPIGNLADITIRALDVLKNVSAIFAEDTRVTVRLLKHYGISVPLLAWHQHSGDAAWRRVRSVLSSGKDAALVTDAGTPGVSDPGGELIERVIRDLPETKIVPIPGASALSAALSIAGVPMREFLYLGYLPHKKGRSTRLRQISESELPVVVFESVHRIQKFLAEISGFGVKVVVARELTKKFESIYRGSAAEVASRLKAEERKGEFVVIVHRHE